MIVALIGAKGRMGQEITQIARKTYSDQIKQIIPINKDTILDTLPDNIDIAIDFSLPQSTSKYLDFCVEKSIPYVSGVTGFTNEQRTLLENAAKKIPLFWAPNMSVGVAVTNLIIDKISGILGEDFKISLEETHHTKKIDMPSGTAFFLKETAQKHRHNQIPVESIRSGDAIGLHRIKFESTSEIIEISHEAKSRALFAQGAIKAALWLKDKKPGKIYGMNDLLGL